MTDTLVEGAGDMAGVPVTDRGTWMQVGGGRRFYPLDPRPEEVYMSDISTALSRILRYNGHSDTPMSVAQHCVQCSYLAQRNGHGAEFRLCMLMHDSAEAYIGDMTRPIKVYFPKFKEIETKIEEVIWRAFNLPPRNEALMKHYDNMAWAWEKRDLYRSAEWWPHTPEIPADLPLMTRWDEGIARLRFEQEFGHLKMLIRAKAQLSDLDPASALDPEFDPYYLGDTVERRRDERDWRDV